MKQSKKAKINQKYENYWKLTLEYSDWKEEKFNETLSIIVRYIDMYEGNITTDIYKKLQEKLNEITPKEDMGSIRKAINQFLKLGFINNGMKSYHRKTKEFLEEKNNSRKRRIYSEILYDNASFSRAFKNDTNVNELNFLVKTLEYCGTLTKDNLLALMYQDISEYSEGYVNLDELSIITEQIINDKSRERKYNQLNYLYNICKNILCGVYIDTEGNITIDKDEEIYEYTIRKVRDPYKQRLYKQDLYMESKEKNTRIACYLEDISYPILIASHIKPYSCCNEEEQFDVQNGLLLSKNIDHLFDQGWITFKDDGTVICSKNLDEKLKNNLKNQSIDKKYLQSEKRLKYLKYHRENIYNENKEYKF